MEAITSRIDGDRYVVSVTGEATIANAKHMRDELLIHVRAQHIALDLSGVADADTAFLGLIASFIVSVLSAGGSAAIIATSPAVDEAMRSTGYRLPSSRTTLTPTYRAA